MAGRRFGDHWISTGRCHLISTERMVHVLLARVGRTMQGLLLTGLDARQKGKHSKVSMDAVKRLAGLSEACTLSLGLLGIFPWGRI